MARSLRVLSEASHEAIDRFASAAHVARADADSLRRLIASSLRLIVSVNNAVGTGNLVGFQVQPEDTHAGAQHDPAHRTITLELDSTRPQDWYDAADTVYLLGHELHHANHTNDVERGEASFTARVMTIAGFGGVDYAHALNAFLDVSRADEDRADLAGWNAFVEFAATSGVDVPDAVAWTERAWTVARVSEADGLVFKEGFQPEPDGTLTPSDCNLATMRRYYTGAAPDMTNIGHTGESDYANYYAAPALSFIGQIHREHHTTITDDHARRGLPRPAEPPIRIDLATHGLTPDLLQKNGIDLGPDAAPLHYLDTSTHPPTPGILQPLRYSRDENEPSRPSTVHEHLRARSTSTRAELRGPTRAPAGTRGDDAAPAESPRPRHAPRTASPTSRSTPGGQNTTPTPRADAARRAVDRATRPRTSGAPTRGNTGIGR